jgi:diguanylate cyclase (GGDEF)-like protein
VVARFGGDEFVVMLRAVDDATARRIGERILIEVARPLALTEGPDHVTVSVGLAPSAHGETALDLADRAMLTAKRQGRDRLVTA